MTYWPSIDGLRAVAILAVIGYHFDISWLSGGYLGVDLFMVISGFLITTTLLRTETDSRRFTEFYLKRIRRLVPASLALIGVVAASAVIIMPEVTHRSLRLDALWSLVYSANWRFVVAGSSYFETVAPPSPFRHLWSLAIEEQFYVLWPMLFFIVFRRYRATATFALAVVSAGMMMLTFTAADASRTYYGTDTRAQALLAGCLVAILVGRSTTRPIASSIVVRYAGLGLVAIGAGFVVTDATETYMYRGGFTVIAVLAAWVVFALIHQPDSGLSRLLSTPALRFVGRRSYSLYLWHWPVIVLCSDRYFDLSGTEIQVIRVILIVALSELSFRLFEERTRIALRGLKRPVIVAMAGTAVVATGVAAVTAGARPLPSYLTGERSVVTIAARDEASQRVPFIRIIGDSVAESLKPGYEQAAQELGLRLEMIIISGCGLMPGPTMSDLGEIYPPSLDCPGHVNGVLESVKREESADLLIWQSAWDAQSREVGGQRLVVGKDDEQLVEMLRQTANDYKFLAEKVVIVSTAERAFTSAVIPDAPGDLESGRYLTAIDNSIRAGTIPGDGIFALDLAPKVCRGETPCPDVSESAERYRPTDGIHYEGNQVYPLARWILEESMRIGSGE